MQKTREFEFVYFVNSLYSAKIDNDPFFWECALFELCICGQKKRLCPPYI